MVMKVFISWIRKDVPVIFRGISRNLRKISAEIGEFGHQNF